MCLDERGVQVVDHGMLLGKWGTGSAAGGREVGIGTATDVRPVAGLGARTEGLAVGEDGVDLPPLPAGRLDPDLVLGREAAGRAQLLIGEQALAGEAGDPPLPGFSSRTSLSGGAAIAKLA